MSFLHLIMAFIQEKKIGCQQLQEMLNFMIIRQVRN